jgi:hypothetical protein
MRYYIQKILLPPSQRRQLQDGYMVLRNHDTSVPRLSTWQGVKITTPTSWSRVNPEMVKVASPCMAPEVSLPGREASANPILNQLKLARTILFTAHLCVGVPTGCFPFGFSYQNCTCISPLNHSLPSPHNTNTIPLWYEFRSSSLCNCLHSSLSVSKYSLHPVLQHLQFTFFELHYRRSWPIFNNRI